MIWTAWFGIGLFFFLAVVLTRERRNPGGHTRQLAHDRTTDMARLRRTRRDIIGMRKKLAQMRKHRSTWFGDLWFKSLVVWLSLQVYHLHLKTTSVFDEFDDFHGLGDKPDQIP